MSGAAESIWPDPKKPGTIKISQPIHGRVRMPARLHAPKRSMASVMTTKSEWITYSSSRQSTLDELTIIAAMSTADSLSTKQKKRSSQDVQTPARMPAQAIGTDRYHGCCHDTSIKGGCMYAKVNAVPSCMVQDDRIPEQVQGMPTVLTKAFILRLT